VTYSRAKGAVHSSSNQTLSNAEHTTP